MCAITTFLTGKTEFGVDHINVISYENSDSLTLILGETLAKSIVNRCPYLLRLLGIDIVGVNGIPVSGIHSMWRD